MNLRQKGHEFKPNPRPWIIMGFENPQTFTPNASLSATETMAAKAAATATMTRSVTEMVTEAAT